MSLFLEEAHLLTLEELESTLLGDIAELLELLNGLETGGMLALADDASSPGSH